MQLSMNAFCFLDSTDSKPRSPIDLYGNIHENGSLFDSASSTHENLEHSFSKFLFDHINLALTKGFDDNVGRYPVPAYFEVITIMFIYMLIIYFLCE